MKRKNFHNIKGLLRPLAVTDSNHPAQTLYIHQSRSFPYSDLGTPGESVLIDAFTAMEQRVNGLLQDRARIGRDLHDSILQSLYAIGLNLEVAWSTSLRSSPNPQRSHAHLVEQLNHLIQEVRAMIASMESGTIQDFDLATELSSLQSTYEQTGRLRIELELQPKTIEVLTTEEEREIVNIVREALSNCARHAGATRVTVTLRLDKTRVHVSIVDNGKGFVPADTRGQGYGLANMKARARKLGGELHTRSVIGQGTAITIDFAIALTPAHL